MKGDGFMKHKLLLAGRNHRLINDFFMQMDFYFECESSSMIYEDMKTHYRYFKPDAFVYCMRTEQRDDIVSVVNFAESISNSDGVPFIVVADNSDFDFLGKLPGKRADLHISTSEPVSVIQEEINSVLIKRKNDALEKANQALKKNGAENDLFTRMEAGLVSMDIPEDLNVSEKRTGKKTGAATAKSSLDSGGRPRILIVDDSTIIHKSIKSYLDNEYNVSSAISGAAALRFLNVQEANLILLDYEMPDMSGPEVLKVLRENPMTADIPVIFLTGINDASKIQKALALRPDGYLLKPVEKDTLLTKVKELIKK